MRTVGIRLWFRSVPEFEPTGHPTDLCRGLDTEAGRLDGSPAIHGIVALRDPYVLSVENTTRIGYFPLKSKQKAT